MIYGDVFGTVMIALIALGVTLIVGLIGGGAVYLYLHIIDKIHRKFWGEYDRQGR
jgi:hypothetical protein